MCFMYITGFLCIDCSSLIWSNKWFAKTKKKPTELKITYKYIYTYFKWAKEINIFISCCFCCLSKSLENMRRKVTRENRSKISNSKKYFYFSFIYFHLIWHIVASYDNFNREIYCFILTVVSWSFFFLLYFQVSIIKLRSRIRAYSSSCFVFLLLFIQQQIKTSLCFNYNSMNRNISAMTV